jgi:hypothetical protein
VRRRIHELFRFVRDTRGLATIEWVIISAVVVLASLAITSFVMNGAGKLGKSIVTKMECQSGNNGNNPDCK